MFQAGETVAAPTLFVFGTPTTCRNSPRASASCGTAAPCATWSSAATRARRRTSVPPHGRSASVRCHRTGNPGAQHAGKCAVRRGTTAASRSARRSAHVGKTARAAVPLRCLLTMRKVFPAWRIGVETVDYLPPDRAGWCANQACRAKLAAEFRTVACHAGRGDIAMRREPYHAPATLLAAADARDPRKHRVTRRRYNRIGSSYDDAVRNLYLSYRISVSATSSLFAGAFAAPSLPFFCPHVVRNGNGRTDFLQ